MGKAQLEDEIKELEKHLEKLKESKPVHDTTGAYAQKVLELQDDIDDKRKALAKLGDSSTTA